MRYCSFWKCLTLVACFSASNALADGPFQATGIKVGEVTDRSVIVWTRLTMRPVRNPSDGPTVKIEYLPSRNPLARRSRVVRGVLFPDGCSVSDLREAVPGIDGDVRLRWKPQEAMEWRETEWRPVDPLGDFTSQISLDDLRSATRYNLLVESRGVDGTLGSAVDASFRTAPKPDMAAKISFVVATCFGDDDQDDPGGFKIYPSMKRLDPDFFVHTGDITYYDELAKSVELARYHWQRMYSWPLCAEFHRSTPSYFMKDDHDTWCNDCWPTMRTPFMHSFTFRQGQQIYREQVPMGQLPYRTFRWGKDVQVWLVEGRDFRSPNDAPDGPEKSIWGAKQKKWFKDSVTQSDAALRILISPTPIVGPDRSTKNDNHANEGFRTEGDEIRTFLAQQRNMFVLCGDRHWQYMSVDPETGLREYSCGPASDEHAGGWNKKDYREDMHRFLRVKGGFASVDVERKQNTPIATIRFHNVDGNVEFEDHFSGESVVPK